MQWKAVLCTSVFLLVTATIAAEDPQGFRGIPWESSFDEVAEQLRETLGTEAEIGTNAYDQSDLIVWEDVLVFGIPSVLFAECSPSRGLVRGWYIFRYGSSQGNARWIADFQHDKRRIGS